ncbi:MAG: hypothetical protein ABEH78_06850 [Haloferacaceae archaeon]
MTLGGVVRVPFDASRYAFREFRKLLFTADRPTGRCLLVDATVADLEATLADAGIESEEIRIEDPNRNR